MRLKELAGRLNLSQTTVSRALNGYPEVSETTRERVLDAARRFGYRPNASAQRLATGRAGAVGAVLQTNRNLMFDPHYVEFLAGLGERLAEDEMDIVLSPTKVNDEMASYRRLATGTRVDALVLSSPVLSDNRVKLLAELGMPFVLHGRTADQAPHAWLDIDNEGAFRQRHQAPARPRPHPHRPHQRLAALHLRRPPRARLPRGAGRARPRGRRASGRRGHHDRRGRLSLHRTLPGRDPAPDRDPCLLDDDGARRLPRAALRRAGARQGTSR